MTALSALAERLAGMAPPAPELAIARTYDAVCALALGSASRDGVALRRFALALDDGGWGGGVLDGVAERVALARMSEVDDIHMPSCTTVGAIVVPTAIGVAAAISVRPETYAAALAAGYEAMTRLGVAIDGAHVVYRGVWPTLFTAPFGAAATTARLLDLDAATTAEALGMALAAAAGAGAGHDAAPTTRWLAAGQAARAGVLAALAAAGAYRTELDLGRYPTLPLDAGALAIDPPQPALAAVSVKPFPCAKQSVAAVEAALALHARGAGDAVDSVRVSVPSACARMVASTPGAVRLSRLASAPWNVALALTRPEQLDDVDRSLWPDAAAARVAGLVQVRADPELDRLYPRRFPARVEVDGDEELVTTSAGDPGAGQLALVDAKCARLLGGGGGAAAWRSLAAEAVTAPGGLEALDAAVGDALRRPSPQEERP